MPNGLISMTLWSERLPIPRLVAHEVAPDGALGGEVEGRREGRAGLVREAEVATVIDPAVALRLSRWLEKQALAALEQLGVSIEEQPEVRSGE